MKDLPSWELVQRFMHEAGFDVPDPDKKAAFPSSKHMYLASRLIQYGMACQLEACCEWMANVPDFYTGSEIDLRAARRSKAPSLKQQAIALLDLIQGNEKSWQLDDLDVVRRALEQLPDE